ncbi:ribonuclease BN [Thermosulfidibacter takaii ABI70S6]|uniref:Ribonuclease BN n=1 Tax=Thermosulfidibacter takaii (strain DSM 17441 / JCM 13301 / NBRC 103674 / ABI70S6) TaxID=1298851 RepID=A0A0S3QS51_THET7|nr:YihY/virulence factor BrkB family protein [Thermosulfidibacter takaii]BAT71133.1 ribonuclease BN [Thermosulfidibacter takaii ABI70S6]
MKKETIKKKAVSLHQWIWSEEEAPFFKNWIRNLLKILEFFWEEARKNALSLRASALTYIIILSMVPLLALGTAVLKGLGAGNMVKKAAYQFIEQFEEMTTPAPTENGKSPVPKNEFAKHLKEAVDKIFEYVERTNFATLGLLGILGLIWAVITTLSKIEGALNDIWKVEKARPWGRKVLDYTAITVIMPLSINVALAAMAASQMKKVAAQIDKFLPIPVVSAVLLKLLPVALLVVTFTILYRFLPNAHVKAFPAFIGGLLGGIGWILVQFAYIKLQIGVTRYNAIYGSFATIPLFLIWIYWGWLVFLYGAQIAFVVQYWKGYKPQQELNPATTLAMAIEVLKAMYKKFAEGKEFCVQQTSYELRIPESFIEKIVKLLLKRELIRTTESGNYLPAMPANKFKLSKVLKAVCGEIEFQGFGFEAATQALKAAEEKLDQFSLEC